MSKDKHKGVARRKFALANAHKVYESGARRSRLRVYDVPPAPQNSSRSECARLIYGRPIVDITKDVRRLVKTGQLKRQRSRMDRGHWGRARHTLFVTPR